MPPGVETPRLNLTGAIVPALAAAALAAIGAILIVDSNGRRGSASVTPANCILDNADGVGGPIDLVDANGARVTQADFTGEPVVIYFGFTHCPDVCPTTMYTLAEALARPGGYDAQAIMITVDPERDTPQVMGAYAHTQGFPPGLVALTGASAQIDAAKRAFQVYSARAVGEAGGADYSVDHTSFLYVLDGQWRTRAIASTVRRENESDPQSPILPASAGDIAACIAAGLDRH